MLTGELRSQVDKVWMSINTSGISNPLSVIEQITYLLFLRRLDELQTLSSAEPSTDNWGRVKLAKIEDDGNNWREQKL